LRISIEAEKELLVKLKEFENKDAFTKKGFTMYNMESSFGANRMYINYILQKYRGKNFSNYINEIRIKYIVNKISNNSEYLNYKISYLAELSGFSNHSRFTQIFKKELQISPSEFIEKLKNDK
jgi:YesN/AraC family two-component response regulator